MSQHPTTSTRQIARAAGTVVLAILLGQIMGLARSMLVASQFPAFERDAFFVANRVSETLFNLIAAGALGSAFLPTFTGLLVNNERDAAWKLASAMGNLVTLSLSFLALISAVFAPQIVHYLLAPGFSSDPALFTLTVDLLRLQLVSAVLFGLGGLLIGILNAHQIFFIPQLTASMYPVGQIVGILALSPWLGIYGLAWGVVLGSVLFVAIQVPTLLKLKGVYTPSLGLDTPSVRRVLVLMGPRVLGTAVVQLNFWVNSNLASGMGEGYVNTLTYGFMLMLMAQAAIAQSVAIAAMPTFSAQFALGKVDEMRASLAASLRGMLLFAIPASLGLIFLANPIVQMLYQRNQFTLLDVEMTAWALSWYAAGMVGHAVLEVLTRAFYARQDTKTPVVVGVGAMALNIALNFVFSAWFSQLGLMPHGGLALANSAATALEAALLFWLMRRQLGGMDSRHILTGVAQCAFAGLWMSASLVGWGRFAGGWSPWAQGLGGVALGGLVYVVLLAVLRVPEVGMILKVIRRG